MFGALAMEKAAGSASFLKPPVADTANPALKAGDRDALVNSQPSKRPALFGDPATASTKPTDATALSTGLNIGVAAAQPGVAINPAQKPTTDVSAAAALSAGVAATQPGLAVVDPA